MNRLLLVVLALLLAALGWQTWRLADSSHTPQHCAGQWKPLDQPDHQHAGKRAAEQKPGTGKEQQPAYQPVHSD